MVPDRDAAVREEWRIDGAGDDERRRDGRQTFAAPGESEPVGGRRGDRHGRPGRVGQHLLRLEAPWPEPRLGADDLDGHVADLPAGVVPASRAVSRISVTPGRAGPLRIGGAEDAPEIARGRRPTAAHRRRRERPRHRRSGRRAPERRARAGRRPSRVARPRRGARRRRCRRAGGRLMARARSDSAASRPRRGPDRPDG